MSERKTPPAVPTTRPSADSTLSTDDLQALLPLAEQISYAGFSTTRTRTIVRQTIPAPDLLKILVVASQVGNSPERLHGKILDQASGRQMMALLSKHRIKAAGATGPDELTLARIASACAPLFLAVRIQIESALQDQGMGLGIKKRWQSPSLAVYSDLTEEPLLKGWLLSFGRAIKAPKETDQEADERTEMFRMIAINNRDIDPYLSISNLGKPISVLIQIMYG